MVCACVSGREKRKEKGGRRERRQSKSSSSSDGASRTSTSILSVSNFASKACFEETDKMSYEDGGEREFSIVAIYLPKVANWYLNIRVYT